MKNVFSDKTELNRLAVQGKLLLDYEYPIYRQIINNRTNLTLLDVGCNDGRKTIERFEKKSFARVVGVDCLKQLVKSTEKKYGDAVFSFHYCDVMAEGFLDRMQEIMKKKNIEAFDVINCSFLLMHLKDPCALLVKLRQILSPGGCLVIIEPDDTISRMQPDEANIFGKFLHILENDIYAGKRDIGGEVQELLKRSGYKNIELKLSEIAAHKGEKEKKENIFITFCSYLPEDLLLLRKEHPENPVYQEWWDWVEKHFDTLHRKMTAEETEISMGMKIYVCGG